METLPKNNTPEPNHQLHSTVHSYQASPTPPSKAERTRKQGLKSIISTILLLLLAPLLAIVITSFVFHTYEVIGPSMETTLQSGDRLIVNKIPRTWASVRGQAFIPDRGEIVVFSKNDLMTSGDNGGKQLIKRVVALPGEKVVVANGVLTVYNNQFPDGFQPDNDSDWGSAIGITDGDVDITVGVNQIFVVGDNRRNSFDSRSFGPIRVNDLVGVAEYRIFPFNKSRGF